MYESYAIRILAREENGEREKKDSLSILHVTGCTSASIIPLSARYYPVGQTEVRNWLRRALLLAFDQTI